MEDASGTELSLAEPPGAAPLALPGRQLAEALHHAQYPALVRFLLLNGASWPEAQDAAQDAFTQMCAPGLCIAYPRAWLRTVAWRSWVRQQVRPEEACADLPEPRTTLRWQTPAQAAEIGEQQRQVIALLLRLPAKQRAALAWNLDGFTTEESARAMGTTQAAVRQNLARARAALKAGLSLEAEGTVDGRKGAST
ncbi:MULTISPECIES: RNA polymerase sigma factor [unclassified Streptomyces]|uniref:RNA polymerase sigma factor n=1 Tax=unclassified Streptomyces TaxID=2593676 RepID=UPI00224EA046|nr:MULTISPECIES: sigma-70 family RNA polymerase sigma factor [unclassified Streptomyces]MCX4529795.1 sigma-70 family RNA polymerase sigma factor [Streptomyces sp. NBC_01551]MCX4539633.1 sigma-70 family RNA polymerase sigma factor [Streptomyces sp. NBC_01565]